MSNPDERLPAPSGGLFLVSRTITVSLQIREECRAKGHRVSDCGRINADAMAACGCPDRLGSNRRAGADVPAFLVVLNWLSFGRLCSVVRRPVLTLGTYQLGNNLVSMAVVIWLTSV